jgi:hypothetical protein
MKKISIIFDLLWVLQSNRQGLLHRYLVHFDVDFQGVLLKILFRSPYLKLLSCVLEDITS